MPISSSLITSPRLCSSRWSFSTADYIAFIVVLLVCVCTFSGYSVGSWFESTMEQAADSSEMDCVFVPSARMKIFTVAGVGFVAGGVLTVSNPIASAMIVGF